MRLAKTRKTIDKSRLLNNYIDGSLTGIKPGKFYSLDLSGGLLSLKIDYLAGTNWQVLTHTTITLVYLSLIFTLLLKAGGVILFDKCSSQQSISYRCN